MNPNDLVNGCLELCGAVLLSRNCVLLRRHREIRGVSAGPTAFFTFWGVWNLYFYPANHLWISFFGGILLATVNLTWLVMAILCRCRRPAAAERPVTDELIYFSIPRPGRGTAQAVAKSSGYR
jgi:hypothetical protein